MIVPALDHWLARLFDPEDLDDTIAALAARAHADPYADEASAARAEAARRKLAAGDDRLAHYRAPMDRRTPTPSRRRCPGPTRPTRAASTARSASRSPTTPPSGATWSRHDRTGGVRLCVSEGGLEP
jgi:hypothetical protein